MRVVYRYKLPTISPAKIKIPALVENGHILPFKDQILKIDMIRDTPSMWCLVDPEEPEIERSILTLGTGWNRKDEDISKDNYVGSYIINDCEIYHIFINE